MNTKLRSVAGIVPAVEMLEGEGMRIRRAFPSREMRELDPFLLLDHLGPVDFAPGEAKGFPDHPHRGFETVTYVIEGQMEHRDSRGNHGTLGPGDVQWMTAGSGLVHSEMPGAEFSKSGGRLHAFQLWVNLPRRDKMAAPRYQEIPAAEVPVAVDADLGVKARIIAGEALGRKGVIESRTEIAYLHLTLQPGARYLQAAEPGSNALVYVIEGEASLGAGSVKAAAGDYATFLRDGGSIPIANESGAPLDVLFIAGEPIGEPVARAGPFVMNTKAEIYQAFQDYQNGLMGRIEAR